MSLADSKIDQIINQMESQFGKNSNRQGCYLMQSGDYGCFTNMETAIIAAKQAGEILRQLNLQVRGKIIDNMRKVSLENARYLAQMAREETGFGRVEHKELKNILAAEKTPGIEDIVPVTYTGDNGMTLVEGASYGVIGAITPSTNPSSTVINNSISMVAGGNAVVFNPHPGAKKVSIETMKILNKAIQDAGGPQNVLCSVAEPSIETSKELMQHKDIRLLVVTGGEAVVNLAMRMGKKVIGAGPGNPPVIVDDTADIGKAAKDIVDGASFDNNILCIAEKEVIVFSNVADALIDNMVTNGCYRLNKNELNTIENMVLEKNKEGVYVPNKKFIGKDAKEILKNAGINTSSNVKLVIAEVDGNHPFVITEMLMPVLPIVRVNDLDNAISLSIKAENGCKHTAIMHSENVSRLTKVARAVDTTIFVKNAPSYAGLGFGGEGYTTLTIATPTGEGLTSAKDFVRSRRCTLSGAFRII